MPTAVGSATEIPFLGGERAEEANANLGHRLLDIAKCDPRFMDVLKELAAMHERKGADYGANTDPYANVRASTEWGVPGWQGCMMRANDKMHRLQQFAIKGTLANEGVEDSLIDMAVYSIIGLILFREQGNGQPRHPEEK